MPGTLTHSPADILRKLLIDLGLGSQPSATTHWPVYVSQQPDDPDNLITLRDTTGIHDGRVHVGGEVQGRDGIQIIVRCNSFPVGWTKADTLCKTLDTDVYSATVTIDTTTYTVHSASRSGGMSPIHLGKESTSSRRELFSINVTLSIREQ
jgi:hypothetical protein